VKPRKSPQRGAYPTAKAKAPIVWGCDPLPGRPVARADLPQGLRWACQTRREVTASAHR